MPDTAEHYDYKVQAWVGADGRYLSCSHPVEMHCDCYGRLHYGELAPVDVTDGAESDIERERRG